MSYNDGEDNRPLPGALPCPFCGGSNIATYAGSTFRWRYAACNECSAQASEVRIETISLPRDKAIEVADRELLAAWNTRAARPEERRMTPKQLDALRMLNDAFESHDGAPVMQAIITRTDYRLLYEALAEGTAGDRIAQELLSPPSPLGTPTGCQHRWIYVANPTGQPYWQCEQCLAASSTDPMPSLFAAHDEGSK